MCCHAKHVHWIRPPSRVNWKEGNICAYRASWVCGPGNRLLRKSRPYPGLPPSERSISLVRTSHSIAPNRICPRQRFINLRRQHERSQHGSNGAHSSTFDCYSTLQFRRVASFLIPSFRLTRFTILTIYEAVTFLEVEGLRAQDQGDQSDAVQKSERDR